MFFAFTRQKIYLFAQVYHTFPCVGLAVLARARHYRRKVLPATGENLRLP